MTSDMETTMSNSNQDDSSNENDVQLLSTYHVKCRLILFILTAFYMIFYVGAFFGFGPMQLMLEEDGAFSNLCNHNTTSILLLLKSSSNFTDISTMSQPIHTCPAQSRTLQYVSFIATILAQLATPLFGDISDRYGPLTLHILLSIMGCVGIAILVLSSFVKVHGLLYLAFILIGFMSMASAPIIMEVASLYSKASSRRRVISSLNCLWDVGGGVGYWILWIITHSSHLSFLLVMGLYLLVGCIVYTTSTYLWKVILSMKRIKISLHEIQTFNENKKAPTTTTLLLTDDSANTLSNLSSTPTADGDIKDTNILPFYQERNCETIGIITTEPIDYSDQTAVAVDSTAVKHSELTVVLSSSIVHKTSFWKHLRSTRFILLTFTFSVHVSRILFTLTSARDFLKYLGDDLTGNRYLTILSLLSPVAILGLPMVDFFVERWGYIVSLQIINIFAIIHGIIVVGSTNLDVQIMGFILLALYRCLTYAIILSYLEIISEKHVLGKLTGIICLIPGLFQLINLPLTNWALDSLLGNFFWPNLVYLLLVIPSILAVWYLGRLQ